MFWSQTDRIHLLAVALKHSKVFLKEKYEITPFWKITGKNNSGPTTHSKSASDGSPATWTSPPAPHRPPMPRSPVPILRPPRPPTHTAWTRWSGVTVRPAKRILPSRPVRPVTATTESMACWTRIFRPAHRLPVRPADQRPRRRTERSPTFSIVTDGRSAYRRRMKIRL